MFPAACSFGIRNMDSSFCLLLPVIRGNLCSAIPGIIVMASIHCYHVSCHNENVRARLMVTGKLIDCVALWAFVRDEVSPVTVSAEVSSPHTVCRWKITHRQAKCAEVNIRVLPVLVHYFGDCTDSTVSDSSCYWVWVIICPVHENIIKGPWDFSHDPDTQILGGCYSHIVLS